VESSWGCRCAVELMVVFGCSALRDRRFPPIEAHELSLLHCTVSFLHSFEKAAGWSDWEVGKHGLIIEFRGEAPNPTPQPG
jgi:AMMECR1 domain-containing protein